MKIFTERIIDPLQEEIVYNIKFVSGCWKCFINLTYFIQEYPIAKIKKVLNWIPEGDTENDVVKGFIQFFECLDYLSRTCNNKSDKSFIKKLQKLNDYAMGLQSHYNEGG